MARRRRSAEQTKGDILAVAVRLLGAKGPAGIRLDDVAGEVGISRQAVLHYFGSRSGLLRAVVEDVWTELFAEVTALSQGAEGLSPRVLVDRLDDTARRKGNARIGAWLLLSGEGLPDEVFEGRLKDLVPRLGASDDTQSVQDRRYALLLLASVTFGDAIFGGRFRQLLGLQDSEAERANFREWLTERLG